MAKTVKKKMTETPTLEGAVFNAEGKKSGTVILPAEVFGVRWNPDLVHQVVSALKENARTPIAHTKDRGEVRGGGRKPWKQKGTGRARHGSTRSPIWVGGGIAHGPRNEKNFSQKANRKMRARALFSVLSKKFGEGEVSFLEALSFKKPATRDAKVVLAKLSVTKEFGGIERKRNAALIALPARDKNVEKSFRNFRNMEVVDIRNLNPVEALTYRRIIIVSPETSLSVLAKRAE